MDLPACARPHLFFCVLFAGLSDSWIEWPPWNSSGIRISGGCCKQVGVAAFLVRAHAAMVFERLAHADGSVLGRYCGFATCSRKCMAAGYADGLLYLFSFLR